MVKDTPEARKSLLTGITSSSIIEEDSYSEERLKTIKKADYDSAELFLEYIRYRATDTFKKALQMQSRNPLFALEEPGSWTSTNLNQKITIKRAVKQLEGERALPDTLPGIASETTDRIQLDIVSKTLETLIADNETNPLYLKYVILSSDMSADLDSYISVINDEYMDDVKYITYIFATEDDRLFMLKNTISTKGIREGYYRTYTIFSKSIVKWTENNGKTKKYIINPGLAGEEEIDKGVYPIIFGVGNKSLVSLLIDVKNIKPEEEATKVNFESLQKKVIAVQTYKPTAAQLKKDLSPSWVAKRLDYNKYGIASEDVTLRNGNSYYWDVGKCWKATTSGGSPSDARSDSYWDIVPYLKGSATPTEGFVGESDVTKKEDIDFSVNILPEVIAKKSYAMIIDDEAFEGLETNGKKGIYFQTTQPPVSTDFETDTETATKTGKISQTKIEGNRRIHPSDAFGNCFYNNKDQVPNNGRLIEAKDKIFDVYFITKEPFAKETTQLQYNILDKLKNGYREIPAGDTTIKKYYIAKKYKEWMKGDAGQADIKNSIKEEEETWKKIVDKFKAQEIIEKSTIPSSVVSKTLTAEDLEKTKIIGGSEIKLYQGYEVGSTILINPDGTVYSTLEMQETDYDNLKKLYICPLKLSEITKHFTYHEATFMIRNGSGNLVQGEYLLSFGYNQERITSFTQIWDLFRKKFASFNKHSLGSSVKSTMPYWRQEGEYILLNKAFVETFFEEEKFGEWDETGKAEETPTGKSKIKDADLKAVKDYEHPITKEKFTITKNEIKKINDEIKSIIEDPLSGFTDQFIDSKVEYIYDRFYDMVCEVWGKTDNKGIRRTKGYFVGGTPFELRKSETTRDVADDLTEEDLSSGYDARELLDYIIEKTMAKVNERDLAKIVFGKLKTFFEKNKRADFSDEETLRKMYSAIDLGVTEAIITSSKRSNYGEMEKDIAKNYVLLAKSMQKHAFNTAINSVLTAAAGAAVAGVVIAAVATHFTILASTTTALLAASAANVAAHAVGPAAALFTKLAAAIGASSAGGPIVFIITAVVVVAIAVVTAITIQCIKKRNEQTSVSPDYVYKFTCRAKRALRQYSMTKRGPLVGPETGGIEGKKWGDVQKRVTYYNWLSENGHGIPSEEYSKANWDFTYSSVEGELADSISQGSILTLNEPYDGRVMVILPTTEEALSDDDVYSMYGTSSLQKIEDFIQTWMGKKAKTVEEQQEIPIQGYYDFYTGMHPWVQVGFRKGLGACGKKIADGGEFYCDETGKPFIFVKKGADGKKSFYNVKEENGEFKEDGTALSAEVATNKIASKYIYFDSTHYPYFKQLQITDNGVKNLKLTLFDANFGSYTSGLNSNGVPYERKEDAPIYSLEAVIRSALRSPVFMQDEDVTKYSSEAGEVNGDYVSIDTALEVSPTNLKIRFGYDDENQNIKKLGETPTKEEKRQNEIWKSHYNVKTGSSSVLQTTLEKRDGRWWNPAGYGITNGFAVNSIKKFVKDGEIQNVGAEWVNIDSLHSAIEKGEVRNSNNASVDHYQMVQSWAQTCQKSREMNFMITGYSTTLKNNGIEYEITAIESKDANVMRTRFLQRYAEITANPEEVLYILMHIFNEDNNGNNVKKSNVKILLISDDDDTYVQSMRDKLNMEYEIKNMREDQFDGTTPYSIYEKAYQTGELEISEEYLRKITLSLGGAAATRNYGSSSQNGKPLYKTLAQLLNEFCSLCPPKKRMELRQDSFNSEGENVLENQESTVARPLKWFSVEDIDNDITYVCLYYRTVMKIPKIRVYTWGPNNPTTSCVKNISIKNSNEFGVLSGIRSFDGKRNKIISRSNADFTEVERATSEALIKSSSVFGSAEYVGIDARNYDNAFASSMYEGNMTIVGDPFWSFDGMMQPCTMPLKLNVVIPQSEFTLRGGGGGEITMGIMSRNYNSYNDGPAYRVEKSKYDETKDTLGVEQFTGGNQILHEMSGYYVVKEIKHNITPTSFTTDLSILSYPNIQKDVLLSKEEYERLKNS